MSLIFLMKMTMMLFCDVLYTMRLADVCGMNKEVVSAEALTFQPGVEKATGPAPDA